MSSERLGGVMAAVPTPVDSNAIPDTERLRTHAKWLLANGCDGLAVLGTTGEANSLSVAQRKRIMTTASIGLDGRKLIVGTGACDLATTVELTRFAAQLRYAGVLVLPPFYYKPLSQEAQIAWYDALIEATAENPVRIILYHFPKMTGSRLQVETVREMKSRHPERIAGIKESSGDLDFTAELTRIENLRVFPGSESALARDGSEIFAGCISATTNVTAPAVAAMRAAPHNQELKNEVIRLREAIAAYPTVPAVKYLVSRRHEDSEFERVLLPHLPLDKDQKEGLDALHNQMISEKTGIDDGTARQSD